MAFTSFRAGSGDYQAVRPLLVNITAVPGNTFSVETYSAASGIAANGGSIADLTTDSLCYAQLATPIAGLVMINSIISATGTLQITWQNVTGSTITPTQPVQLNVLVF